MPVFVERQHLHRNVARRRILLQVVQHRPAQHVGQENVQRHCGWMVLLGQRERLRPAGRHKNFEALVARKIAQHARVVRIIFHNQQDRIVRLQIFPVVGNLLDRMFHDRQRRRQKRTTEISSLAAAIAVEGPT